MKLCASMILCECKYINLCKIMPEVEAEKKKFVRSYSTYSQLISFYPTPRDPFNALSHPMHAAMRPSFNFFYPPGLIDVSIMHSSKAIDDAKRTGSPRKLPERVPQHNKISLSLRPVSHLAPLNHY